MTTHQPQKEAGAVICPGLFILVTGDTATAHIIPPDDATLFCRGAVMAIDSQNPDGYLQDLIRRTFHVKDCLFALPAHDKGQLARLMDDYNGPSRDSVRALAASWLAGVPFTRFDQDDKGATDRIPKPPTPPPTPAGTNQPESIKPQLKPTVEDTLTLDSLLALAVPS